MTQYRVFTHPSGASEAVKQGWSWPAFFFTNWWALCKHQYMLGASVLAASIAFGAAMGFARVQNNALLVLNVIGLGVSSSNIHRRCAKPFFHDELSEFQLKSVVKPVLDHFVKQHEVLWVEDDPRRIAMLEPNHLARTEYVAHCQAPGFEVRLISAPHHT